MIYILSGNDNKKKNTFIKKLCGKKLPAIIPAEDAKRETFLDYAGSVSLFGESPIVVCDNVLKKEGIEFTGDELEKLKESETIFIFTEDKISAVNMNKYSKYGKVEVFNTEVIKKLPKINIFGIADAYARRDKINTWSLYQNAVQEGISPEEISGILFWKIKMMILDGTKFFKKEELYNISSSLVSIYHEAHRGETDFTIALEQFILSTLSK